VIRVEDVVDEDVVLMLEEVEVEVEVEVEDCEVVVESTEPLLLEELTLRLDERLLDKLLDRLLERLFDRLLEMLLEMLLKQLKGHDALELVVVVEGVWIVLLDETEVVEAIILGVLEDVVVELELVVDDLTLLVDVWTELESVEDDELAVDFVLETEVVEKTELEVLEDFWVELEVVEEDLILLVDVWTELELEVVVFWLEEEEVVVGITIELPEVDVACDELDVVVWLDDDDDVELVDTVAAGQAPVTDGTALTPELTGMMFDPCNINSKQFWAYETCEGVKTQQYAALWS
jgi:hypothetical protein